MKRNDEPLNNAELFYSDGHLTDTSFELLIQEKLDPLQSLEVSEHLSFCDQCLERYTAILCGNDFDEISDISKAEIPPNVPAKVRLMEAPKSLLPNVMHKIQHKTNVFYFQKISSVAIAASLALVFWSGGLFSAKHFSNRADHLMDEIQSSSQSFLEHTNKISEDINDFFGSLQNSISRRNRSGAARINK